MLSKLAIRRLTKLADYMAAMKTTKHRRFNMASFFFVDECGTVACACGWAQTMPYFQRLGATMDGDWNPQQVFDGDHWDALFSGRFARTIHTPKQWAAHCRKYIRENA